MMKEFYMLETITRVRAFNEVEDVTGRIMKVIIVMNTPDREFIHTTDTSRMTWFEAECTARKLTNEALTLYNNRKLA